MKAMVLLVYIFCFFFSTVPAFPVVTMNDLVPVFIVEDGNAIEDNVIDGASNFLTSYSEAILAINNMDFCRTTGENISSTLIQIEKAWKSLLESNKAYELALQISKNSEYTYFYQSKLINYNYLKCIQEFKLERNIADEVVSFLNRGDVIGLYEKNIKNLSEILQLLKFIRENIETDNIPTEDTYLYLYQQYNEAGLFGNYATFLGGKAIQGD